MPDLAQAAEPPVETTQASAARSVYLDALRGFAIILVVMGHVAQRSVGAVQFFAGGAAHQYLPKNWGTVSVFSFGYWHMPLFMAISGYLTFGHIRRPIEQWLNRKALALLVPFLSWMLVYYWVPDQFLKKGDNFVDFVWITVRNPGNGLWYLPVLFVFYALAALVEEGPIGDWGLLVVGIVISAFTVSPLVGVDQMQLVWWWFAIGYLFAKHQDKLMKWRNYGWAAGVIAYPVALFMVEHFKDLAYVPVLKLAGIIVSTLLVYGIVRIGAGRPFAYLGVHSLEIYAAQFVFTSLAIGAGLVRIPLVTAIAIAGSLAIGALFRLNPYTDMLFLGGRYRRATREVSATEPS